MQRILIICKQKISNKSDQTSFTNFVVRKRKSQSLVKRSIVIPNEKQTFGSYRLCPGPRLSIPSSIRSCIFRKLRHHSGENHLPFGRELARMLSKCLFYLARILLSVSQHSPGRQTDGPSLERVRARSD